jgi:hypothetical protein
VFSLISACICVLMRHIIFSMYVCILDGAFRQRQWVVREWSHKPHTEGRPAPVKHRYTACNNRGIQSHHLPRSTQDTGMAKSLINTKIRQINAKLNNWFVSSSERKSFIVRKGPHWIFFSFWHFFKKLVDNDEIWWICLNFSNGHFYLSERLNLSLF